MAETSALSLLMIMTWFLFFSMVFTKCIESEKSALLEIQRDIYDPDGKWLSSWGKSGDCCSNWHGVECNNRTGHVTKLDLKNPNQSNPSVGPSKLNSALLHLAHLEYLDLSSNNFSSAPLPEFIGSLTNLKYLDLSDTNFNGTIPPTLGNLSNLQTLNIFYSTASFDPSFISLRVDNLHWLAKLTSLSQIMLGGIDLSKAVDWAYDISMLPSLSDLSMNGCELSYIPANLPSVDNLTSLTTVDLSMNNLRSTIPGWLLNNISSLVELYLTSNDFYGEFPLVSGHSSNLKKLYLPWNHITGSFPISLENYTQLESLFINSNNISGKIPERIGNLLNLVDLDLSDNQISGRIPNSIGNLQNLIIFSLADNPMEGEIPVSLSNMTRLQNAFLSNINIGGSIPDAIGNLNNLETLDLSSNRLSGPMFFLNMSSLTVLDLSDNYLSGRLPWFLNESSQMESLYLSYNRLSGNMPDLFGSLPYLRSWHLDNNELTGGIPLSLKNCQQLFVLDLSQNKLSGDIPTWIGKSLSSLAALVLRSNEFTGSIPPQLSYLTSLQILDLSNNNLTGTLSLSFQNFSAMNSTHEAGDRRFQIYSTNALYTENLWLNVKGSTADYTDVLSAVTIIDLSSNNLSGEIPNGIMHLRGLYFLNLSRNHFTGKIPDMISSMIQLQSLDLSTNNISGEIPSSMTALTFLSYLNLSNNNLSGTIPSGNQFSTFSDPSVYSGNKDLCGWPLPQCASGAPSRVLPSTNGQKEENEVDFEMMWAAIFGFAISYSAFIGVIIIKKSFRYAYFHSVDNLLDWFALHIASLKSTM